MTLSGKGFSKVILAGVLDGLVGNERLAATNLFRRFLYNPLERL